MKKLFLGIAVLGLLAGISSAADIGTTDNGSNFGVGFVLGDPSGISAKITTSEINSINLILGYDESGEFGNGDCCNDGGRLYLGGDYVWYNYNLIHVAEGRLPIYYGPGVWASLADHSSLGVRVVLGMEYQFANAPFDIFLEIGPGIRIIPNTDGDVSAGLGTRFFF